MTDTNYQEYFPVEEPAEPIPTPPKPDIDPDADLIDRLEEAINNQERINDIPLDKLQDILREKKEQMVTRKEAVKKAEAEKAMDKEMKEQYRLLSAKYSKKPEYNIPSDPDNQAAWKRYNDWSDFKKLANEQQNRNLDRARFNIPQVEKPKKPLNELTIEERTAYFEKVGLLKRRGPPKSVR